MIATIQKQTPSKRNKKPAARRVEGIFGRPTLLFGPALSCHLFAGTSASPGGFRLLRRNGRTPPLRWCVVSGWMSSLAATFEASSAARARTRSGWEPGFASQAPSPERIVA